jgi:hypothetical protein
MRRIVCLAFSPGPLWVGCSLSKRQQVFQPDNLLSLVDRPISAKSGRSSNTQVGHQQMHIKILLDRPGSGWFSKAPASQTLIGELCAKSPVVIPSDLLELWSFSNGGESDYLKLPPCNFVLDSVEEVIQTLTDDHYRTEYPSLFFFGGNGGLERLALDYRETAGPAVVMIDPIAGLGSVQVIASTIFELLSAIAPYPEEFDDSASSDGYNY